MPDHYRAGQTAGTGDTREAVQPQATGSPGWSHPARSPGELSHESQHSKARVLPDPAICWARAAGFGDYADCLVEHPYQCPHALSFGYSYLCRHPQRHVIVLRTSARGE